MFSLSRSSGEEKNVQLNFRQQEENHVLENVIYNELLAFGNSNLKLGMRFPILSVDSVKTMSASNVLPVLAECNPLPWTRPTWRKSTAIFLVMGFFRLDR